MREISMFFGRRLALGLALVAGLAACSGPATFTAPVRAGVGSDVNLGDQRPPSGTVYRYLMRVSESPAAFTLQLRSRRVSSTRMVYTGTLGVPLPGGSEADEVAATFREGLAREGLAVRRGQLLIPIETRTDNRFRSISERSLRDSTRYDPHDCWAVLGRCEFDEIADDGTKVRIISDTTEENGVWVSERRSDPSSAPRELRNMRATITYSIDRNGVMIDVLSRLRGGPDGPETVFIQRQ